MKDSTLLAIPPVLGIRMWLDDAGSRRVESGYIFFATVSGEATAAAPFGGKQVVTATASAEGESPNGAQLLAFAACMRAFIAQSPFPDAFARDVQRLEAEQADLTDEPSTCFWDGTATGLRLAGSRVPAPPPCPAADP